MSRRNERTSLARILVAMSGLLALLLGLDADVARADLVSEADAKAYLEEIAERLDLSDEQRAQVRPVLEQSAKDRQAILHRHGINKGEKPSGQQIRDARPELKAEKQQTRQELEEILTDEQMKELRRIEEDMHQKLRKQAREQRHLHGSKRYSS